MFQSAFTPFSHARVSRVAALCALLLLGGCAGFPLAAMQDAASTQPQAVATGPGAPEMFRLANGMDVLVIPDHRAPVVTHIVWYRVGSADETPGKTGLAHFLEHLMFKGTDKIAPGEFSKIVARNGGQDNAFTSYDFTAYYQAIAKDRLPLVMEMEADRMTHLKLTDKEVLPERDVVIEELRMRIENEPVAELQSKINAALYGASPYGRDVIGVKSEVQQLQTDDALDFYRRFYTPNNAILIVAGDVTAAELKPLAEKYYGVIKPRAPTLKRKRAAIVWPEEPKRVTLHDPRVREETWIRAYPAPSSAQAGTRRSAALDVLAEIIGGGTTSRLYQSLVVRDRVATAVQAWYEGDKLGAGEFGVYALPRVGRSASDAEKAVDAELAKFLAGAISADELKRAKSQLIASAVYARDTQRTLAYAYGSGMTTGLTAGQVYEWPDYIRAVTAKDVLAAAKDVLDARHAVNGVLVPEAKK